MSESNLNDLLCDTDLCSWLRGGINGHVMLSHQAAERIEKLNKQLDAHRVAICNYWYCPECKEEVDGSRVTFSEHHDADCDSPVIAVELNHVVVPIKLLATISNMCIGKIAMGFDMDAEAIGDLLWEATGMTNEEMNANSGDT